MDRGCSGRAKISIHEVSVYHFPIASESLISKVLDSRVDRLLDATDWSADGSWRLLMHKT